MLDTLTTLSVPYLLALFALTVQWLLAVWQQARMGRRPVLAYLAAPGLAALLGAPLAQAEPLFGLGAALVLIAAYWSGAYAPVPADHHRQALRWGRPLALALALLGAVSQGFGLPPLFWVLWAAALTLSLGYLLSSGRQSKTPVAAPGLALRFGALTSPAWPDLELRVEGNHARLQNIGSSRLLLAGWSPSGQNGWLRPQDTQGKALSVLPKGGTALLAPWPAGQSGVRVWYVRQSAPQEALVFRADWTPLDSPRRVLN
jgi:hypothetical protein